jgi:hypothetical protein
MREIYKMDESLEYVYTLGDLVKPAPLPPAELESKRILELMDSSIFRAAEDMLHDCQRRHNHCFSCSEQAACRQAWDDLINQTDAFYLSLTRFNHYRKELEHLEAAGNEIKRVSICELRQHVMATIA